MKVFDNPPRGSRVPSHCCKVVGPALRDPIRRVESQEVEMYRLIPISTCNTDGESTQLTLDTTTCFPPSSSRARMK